MNYLIKIYFKEYKYEKEIAHLTFSFFLTFMSILFYYGKTILLSLPTSLSIIMLVINLLQHYFLIRIPADYYKFLYRFVYFNNNVKSINNKLLFILLHPNNILFIISLFFTLKTITFICSLNLEKIGLALLIYTMVLTMIFTKTLLLIVKNKSSFLYYISLLSLVIIPLFFIKFFNEVRSIFIFDENLFIRIYSLLITTIYIYVHFTYSLKTKIKSYLSVSLTKNSVIYHKYFWYIRDIKYLLRCKPFTTVEILGNIIFLVSGFLAVNDGRSFTILILGWYTLYLPNLYYTLNFFGYEADELKKYNYFPHSFKMMLINKIFLSILINILVVILFSLIVIAIFKITIVFKFIIIFCAVTLCTSFLIIGINSSKKPFQYSFEFNYSQPVIPYQKIYPVIILLLLINSVIYFYLLTKNIYLLTVVLVVQFILSIIIYKLLHNLINQKENTIQQVYF